jgi:excinuclease ABC subunit A
VEKEIVIKGARENNLKNLSLTIPRNKFVVITGLSGSGKSSLAFDTIYAEGQRRYLESLSAYARQFLEQMRKPNVDSIDGLSPSISIEQKNITRNPRSTVGTVTEIYDYLRLMYARIGIPHCFSCGKPIQSQTVQQIIDRVLELPVGSKFAVLAPIIRGKKGEYQKELAELQSRGYVRARIDGTEVNLSTPIKLQKNLKHDISIYVDRLMMKAGIESRLAEALEMAAELTRGLAEVEVVGEDKPRFYSTKFACADCGTSFPELEPRSFSFNSPHGACPKCNGLGTEQKFDPNLIVPDASLSLKEGAIAPWNQKPEVWRESILGGLAAKFKFNLDTPFEKLSQKIQKLILQGSGEEKIEFKYKLKSKIHHFDQEFEGVLPSLQAELREAGENWDDSDLTEYLSSQPCADCQGTRLKPEILFVRLGGKNISEFCSLNIDAAKEFISSLKLNKSQTLIATQIIKEIIARLTFLSNVGLSYLTLSRSAQTLSGGESQRIRLATQIGSNLVGVLYVLDEPSIGLHQRDNDKLIETLERLRDQGNSVIVVEHDEDTIRHADYVIDIGPGAGEHGGQIIFQGSAAELLNSSESLTAQYMNGKLFIPVPDTRRTVDAKRVINIEGAYLHNLKKIDVEIPLGLFVCVTGVSGSGKSTLVIDTLLKALKQNLAGDSVAAVKCEKIIGLELLDKVVHVDQGPIGRTPRSNPATYTGIFSDIRTLFAELPEAKVRGYKPSRFSFNVSGGRGEACRGDGNMKISMHFLPDVFVECEICHGRRYNRETLEVLYRSKSIADVLAMTVEQAYVFFERVPNLKFKFKTLFDVGLGYVQVGQSAVTLSGGEAQRIKLAKELNRRSTGRTIYILDEPTTGLHFADVKKLLEILQSLVAQGNTVIVIEHNLDVIKQADHVIDLGPEGGDAGGEMVYYGSPEGLAACEKSYTGKYLKKLLTQKKLQQKSEEKTPVPSTTKAPGKNRRTANR